MAELVYSKSQDQYYYQNEDGSLQPVPAHVAELENDPLQRMLIGAGRQLTRLGRGASDLLFGGGDEMAQRQMEENRLYAPLQQAFPISTGIGEALPGLATAPIGAGTTSLLPALGTAIGVGALEGGLTYSADPGQQVAQALTGGAFAGAGFGLGRMASRVLSGISRAADDLPVTPEAQRLIDLSGSERVVTPAQRYGSDATRIYEESLLSNPVARANLAEPAALRQTLTNQRAAASIGMPGEQRLTEEVLAAADNRLADFYQNFAQGVERIDIDPTLQSRLMSRKEIRDIVELGGLETLEDGYITTGQDILDVRSTLTGLIGDATGKRSGQFASLQRLLNEFDDQVASNFGPEAVTALNRANEQFRNLSLLQKLNVVKDGDVSAKMLRNRLQQSYRKTFTQNRAENVEPETAQLMDWLKAETAPGVAPIVGSSGTAERLGAQQLTADVAEGIVNRDPGAIARTLGTMTMGNLYSSMARDYPGFIGGLLTPLPDYYGAQIGARLFGPEQLEQFRGE